MLNGSVEEVSVGTLERRLWVVNNRCVSKEDKLPCDMLRRTQIQEPQRLHRLPFATIEEETCRQRVAKEAVAAESQPTSTQKENAHINS